MRDDDTRRRNRNVNGRRPTTRRPTNGVIDEATGRVVMTPEQIEKYAGRANDRLAAQGKLAPAEGERTYETFPEARPLTTHVPRHAPANRTAAGLASRDDPEIQRNLMDAAGVPQSNEHWDVVPGSAGFSFRNKKLSKRYLAGLPRGQDDVALDGAPRGQVFEAYGGDGGIDFEQSRRAPLRQGGVSPRDALDILRSDNGYRAPDNGGIKERLLDGKSSVPDETWSPRPAVGTPVPGDSDGDGIPDGADMTETHKSTDLDGNQTTRQSKWKKGQGQGNLGSFSLRPSGELPAIGVDKHQDNLDRLALSKGRNSRDTGQLAAAQEVRDRRDRPAMREHEVALAGIAAKEEAAGVQGAAGAIAGAENNQLSNDAINNASQNGVRFFDNGDGTKTAAHGGRLYQVGTPDDGADPYAIPLYGDDGETAGYMNSQTGDISWDPARSKAGGGEGEGEGDSPYQRSIREKVFPPKKK